jgi:hypothetical protein
MSDKVKTTTLVFSEMECDEKQTYCYWKVCVKGIDWCMSSGMSFEEARLIANYFGFKTPEELVQTEFEDNGDGISCTLEEFIKIQQFGADYIPPTNTVLYERVALCFSQMKCPDFSDIDRISLYKAFAVCFPRFYVNKCWFKRLQYRVRALSQGRVRLEKSSDHFPVRVRGSAEYLSLIDRRKNQKILVILGPYAPPITFYRN